MESQRDFFGPLIRLTQALEAKLAFGAMIDEEITLGFSDAGSMFGDDEEVSALDTHYARCSVAAARQAKHGFQ